MVAELKTSPETVGRIVFRDQKGKIRCSIGLAFNDASGSQRLNLGVSVDSGYGLEFYAPDQTSLGGLGVSSKGEYGLTLADSLGNTRFDLGLTLT